MCQISISIPNEVLFDTNMRTSDASAFAKKMVALGYYTQNHVSIGYCAQIADMTEEEFITFLGQNRIDLFRYENDEELMRDIANA